MIAAEIAATCLLKYTVGFTKLWPSLACICLYCTAYYLLSKYIQNTNLGVIYATWSASGAAVTTLVSIFLFHQKISPAGILGIVLIVSGVIILNLIGTPAN